MRRFVRIGGLCACGMVLSVLALADHEGGWVRDRLPLSALSDAFADSYDDHVPLLSADMLVMAEASDAWNLQAATRTSRDLAQQKLVLATRDALLERWRTWKLDDPGLTGAVVNLLTDFAALSRLYEPQDEFLLSFEKSLQIRVNAFFRATPARPPLNPADPPGDLVRRYALEHALDLDTPAGQDAARVWVHLLRTDPALAQDWEALRREVEEDFPQSDTVYRRVLKAATGLPLGRMTDLLNPRIRRAFRESLKEAGPRFLPLVPLSERDDGAFLARLESSLPREQGAWLRALSPEQGPASPQPGHDPALTLAPHGSGLALARWLMTDPESPPPDKALRVPLADDWRVECQPGLYRAMNRWHAGEAARAEAALPPDADLAARARSVHHRRWQAIFGLLQTCTPEPAHSALDFARLPLSLAAPDGPLLPSLAMTETLGRRLEGLDADAPVLLPLWWPQTIRADLPHLPAFGDLDPDDDVLPPLAPLPAVDGVPPEAAAPRDPASPPPPRRIRLLTLRVSVGQAAHHDVLRPDDPGDIVPVGPRPPLHIALPE